MKFRLLFPILLAPLLVSAQTPPTVDETARFLAGLPVEGPLAPLMQTPQWQEHARAMDEAWARKQAEQIVPLRNWMTVNAQEFFTSTAPVFYMFAGPDFLYADAFFPYAGTYILAGLEPLGQVQDLTLIPPADVVGNLANLRVALGSVLRFQYFITKDMRSQLGRNISGTLPLMYVFLARTGHTILEVERLTSPADGVKITFRDNQRAQTQTLFYFKTNLGDGSSSAFLKWCAERGRGLSLLKAASFLMHGGGFSGVRNFLLEHSEVIIQDDSGIPLRAFPKGWSVSFFGHYVPHRTDFAKYTQPDLLAAVQRNRAGLLGFAFGYHWQKEEGFLMLATPQARELPVKRALPPD